MRAEVIAAPKPEDKTRWKREGIDHRVFGPDFITVHGGMYWTINYIGILVYESVNGSYKPI